jgi:hypothetical protein
VGDDEAEWDAVRVILDQIGMLAVEDVVAAGVPPEVAGARVTRFNDMLIARLKVEGFTP